MTRKDKLLRLNPQPRSNFLLVQCPECSSKQIIFSHASIEVKCFVCGKTLAKPTGGKAKILGKILKKYYE
ncbi:MAG: 30S ribosomal protein S27e [Candidatus Njordarchaeia archaeon]|nr:30S ribosomal protein S27e [Candidatus Korarchaeota archaeon]